MADTQAKSIRDLLIQSIAKYNSSINLDTTGRAYAQIVDPIYEALSPDMFEAEVEEYLLAALKEQYPSLELQDGDMIIDLLVRPLQLLLEPLKREINLLRKRQSTRYPNQLTDEDAEDLAANFFVKRKLGRYSTGVVRVFLSAPTYVTVNANVRFSTSDGLSFLPANQSFISAATVALNRSGNLFYADIQVVSEEAGAEYNVEAGSIVRAEGIPTFVSVTNPFPLSNGVTAETKEDLLSRVESSLTERSITTRKGITAQIENSFAPVSNLQIIGYGDPEMERDILTGSGEGKLIASGVSILFGRYVFMLTGYEDASAGNTLPAPGDKVKLNFWKFIYQEESIETNEIQDILYSSYSDAPDSPTVHIFLLKNTPEQTLKPVGALPGTLPAVFISIFSEEELTISGLPEGIYDGGSALPFRVKSNKVHIGGRFDVWSSTGMLTGDSSSVSIHKSQYIDKSVRVSMDGTPSNILKGRYPLNRVRAGHYRLRLTDALPDRIAIYNTSNNSRAFISEVIANGLAVEITCVSGEFSIGDALIAQDGSTATILDISREVADANDIGSVLTVTTPGNEASYSILGVHENYYIIGSDINTETSMLDGYIHKSTGINNIFNPSVKVFPEIGDYATGLQTFIGRQDIYIQHDIVSAGVAVGDVLEILSGIDRGQYTINAITLQSPSLYKVDVSAILNRTNSNLRFKVIRTTEPVSAPLVSVPQNGLVLPAEGVVHNIPYAKSVGAYALGAFSGTVAKYEGVNGFVLPNLGEEFKGSGAYLSSLAKQPVAQILQQFTNTKFDDCISEGCTECEGIPIVVSVTIGANAAGFSNVKTYITGATGALVDSYLTDLRQWFISFIDSVFRGTNSQQMQTADDLSAFIKMFAPLTLGEPTNPNEYLISQFEMCLPLEVFDECNNVYIAIPEIDWDSAFASVSTFEQAIIDFLSGDLYREATALSFAKPGDSLKVDFGANAGEYVIDKVLNIPLYTDSCIQTETTVDNNGVASTSFAIHESRAFPITLVVIKGTFPYETLKGSASFYRNGIPNVSQILPVPPAYPNSLQVQYISGTLQGTMVNPFSVVEEIYSVVFKGLYAQGFDLPEQFSLKPGPTLTSIVKKFFSSYTTGVRSPQQTSRMLFQDPVDVTVYSPQTCRSISWQKEKNNPAGPVKADLLITLPMAALNSKTAAVSCTINMQQAAVSLSGSLPAEAGTTGSIERLVEILQAALDPNYEYIQISYETVNVTAYRIVINTLFGGKNSFLRVVADSGSDAFYVLGFCDSSVTRDTVRLAVNNNLLLQPQLPLLTTSSLGYSSIYLGVSEIQTWAVYGTGFAPPIGGISSLHITDGNGTTTAIRFTVIAQLQHNSAASGFIGVTINNVQQSNMTNMLGSAIQGVALYYPDNSVVVDSSQVGQGTVGSRLVDDLSQTVGLRTENIETLFPFAYDTSSNTRNQQLTVKLLFDSTTSYITKNSLVHVISDSIKIDLIAGHLGTGQSPTISAILDTRAPTGIYLEKAANNDAFSIISASSFLSLVPTQSVSFNVRSTFSTIVAPLNVTVGSSSTTFCDSFTINEIATLENQFSTAPSVPQLTPYLVSFLNAKNTSTDFACYYLNDTNPSIGFIVIVPLSANNISISPTYAFSGQSTILDHITAQGPSSPFPTTRNAGTLNFSIQGTATTVEGTSVLDTETTTKEIKPHNGTRFTLTQHGESRELVVDIQDNEDYYYSVMPRKHANLELVLSDLQRDSVFSGHFALAQSCLMMFTADIGESALQAGVEPGDLVYLYEQRQILDNSNLFLSPFSEKKDRLLHVVYDDFRQEASLLSSAGNFLYPENYNPSNNQIPSRNTVKVGDIVYFEQLGQIATVTTVNETKFTIDKKLNSAAPERVIRHNTDGVVVNRLFVTNSYSFTSDDVGKYLVIYGSENSNVDGTYEITHVPNNGGAVLESDTTVTEANLHWCLVIPGFTSPGSSSVGGFNQTLGVTPIRIYSGTPSVFEVGETSPHISRENSIIEILYGNTDGGPFRGVRQPFKILRKNQCRMTARDMAAQGQEGSLYYFDVPSTTLTPTFDLNIKEDTQYTPVFKTYKSNGYYFNVLNTAHTFSAREETELIISSSILPSTSTGSLTGSVTLEGEVLNLSYLTCETLNSLQVFIDQENTKTLAADPLVRHFLPGYISINIPYSSGDAASAQEAVVNYINGLGPKEDLMLSKIEKQLHYYDIDLYNHPVYIYCLATDLDRNVVLTRSNNKIGTGSLLHNGTNRITDFIALDSAITLGVR